MTDIVERLRQRQMMQDVRGTGDRFTKQIPVPDALCQLAADEIERLRAERDALRADAKRLTWYDNSPDCIGFADGWYTLTAQGTLVRYEDLRSAIDAAMAAQTTDN